MNKKMQQNILLKPLIEGLDRFDHRQHNANMFKEMSLHPDSGLHYAERKAH